VFIKGYCAEDLVILTPYVGQLKVIRDKLRDSFTVTISDRDIQEMRKMDDEDDVVEQNSTVTKPAAVRVSLGKCIRVSTIDNYQGEEATIVIISLVRNASSAQKSIGFLKTSNRINVLLSRAKHGMYILGNKQILSSKSKMWEKVMQIFEDSHCAGPGVEIVCQNHPQNVTSISEPSQFAIFAPGNFILILDGGCNIPCGVKLPSCGHICPFRCHSDFRSHVGVACSQDCPRLHPVCNHLCPKRCHEVLLMLTQDCGDCVVNIGNVTLPCGHSYANTPCYLSRDLKDTLQCSATVEATIPGCLHSVELKCHQAQQIENVECSAPCEHLLEGCLHPCPSKCGKCRRRGTHSNCNKICGKNLPCGHQCASTCHGEEVCPKCTQPCQVWKCKHAVCKHICGEPCKPCQERCDWACEHQGSCMLVCGAPCTRLPCDIRCARNLTCGHRCPSVCGEACPEKTYCHICASEDKLSQTVDMIMFDEYRNVDLNDDPVIFLSCGHFFTISTLDGFLQMKKVYSQDEGWKLLPLPEEFLDLPCCIQCRKPIRMIKRYGRVCNRASMNVAEKQFLSEQSVRCRALAERVQITLRKMDETQLPTVSDVDFQGKVVVAKQVSQYLKDTRRLLVDVAKLSRFVIASPQTSVYQSCVSLLRRSMSPQSLEIDAEILKVSLPKPYYTPQRDVMKLETQCKLAIAQVFARIVYALPRTEEVARRKVTESAERTFRQLIGSLRTFMEATKDSVNDRSKYGIEFLLLECEAEELRFLRLGLDNYEVLVAVLDQKVADFKRTAVRSFLESGGQRILRLEELLAQLRRSKELSVDEKKMIFDAMNQTFTGSGHWYTCQNGHIVRLY
jgi:AAA domain